jgi:hypothetical protein
MWLPPWTGGEWWGVHTLAVVCWRRRSNIPKHRHSHEQHQHMQGSDSSSCYRIAVGWSHANDCTGFALGYPAGTEKLVLIDAQAKWMGT